MKNSNKILVFLFMSQLMLHVQISFSQVEKAENNSSKVEFDVGVILDLDEVVGRMRLRCMSMALSDFYATHASYKTRVVLHPRNSYNDNVAAASAALDLLKNTRVQAIIGPETSAQTNFVADLGEKSNVPILSFSATNPSVTSARNPYFIRTIHNDSAQIEAIVAIFQAFGWIEVILISEETDDENQVIFNFVDAFEENDILVSYISGVSSSATDEHIGEQLYRLMSMQCKVFVVHMTASLGSRLFHKAKRVGMMSQGYSFIVMDGVTNVLSSMDSSTMDSMQGVLGVRPYIPNSKELDNFRVKLKEEFLDTTLLSIFELWAYDTVWALGLAAEEVEGFDHGFLMPEVINSSGLAILGVSKIGPKLVQAISDTTFKGLSGEFHIVDRQLQSSIVEIVNVIGNQGRRVGIWSPTNGILRELYATKKKHIGSLNSKENLRAIIWPGESTSVPKGWFFSTNGRTLKVGVPVKRGFTEFVKVEKDPKKKLTNITGYCIDLFEAVMNALPYDVPYEYIPLERPDGRPVGNYDSMLYQVFLQKFDAVVGDVTILSNRSLYVDFTLPYSETGISMIVGVEGNDKKDAWIFLKPLSKEMWLTTAAAFVFTGCILWVLEHRINTKFQGSFSEQLGMIFWFSFSTFVFAHREKVISNFSRFVLIIWVFVVLILTSSYTASLTSMLTVQKLAISDVNQLSRNGQYIGYQGGSYIKRILNSLNIDDTKLKALSSLDEYASALSKGSKKGGVSAIYDETPYLKLFLARYCDKYTMVGPVSDTNGFGFVFRKGSPLVLPVSKAILEVKQSETMKTINLKWYGNKTNCEDSGSSNSLQSLTVGSFRGLFFVTVIASICAVFVFFCFFIHEHLHVLTNNSGDSFGRRLINLVKIFYEDDTAGVSMVCDVNSANIVEPEGHVLPLSGSAVSESSQTTSEEIIVTAQSDVVSSEEQLPHPNSGSMEMRQTQ